MSLVENTVKVLEMVVGVPVEAVLKCLARETIHLPRMDKVATTVCGDGWEVDIPESLLDCYEFQDRFQCIFFHRLPKEGREMSADLRVNEGVSREGYFAQRTADLTLPLRGGSLLKVDQLSFEGYLTIENRDDFKFYEFLFIQGDTVWQLSTRTGEKELTEEQALSLAGSFRLTSPQEVP